MVITPLKSFATSAVLILKVFAVCDDLKTKAHHGDTARRSCNQKTRPLHHGGAETRGKAKDRWIVSDLRRLRCLQGAVSLFQTLSLQQKDEDTEESKTRSAGHSYSETAPANERECGLASFC